MGKKKGKKSTPEQSSSGGAKDQSASEKSEATHGGDKSGHSESGGGRGRGEGGRGRGEGGRGRGEGGRGRGEGGRGRGEDIALIYEAGRGRGEGGRGRGEDIALIYEAGRGRGEGGRGRGEGGPPIYEGGRGRGEGGRGRGEGGPPIYEGGRGRGEGGPPIYEGGRGRGEGGPPIHEGGRGRGEGGPPIHEGGRGRGEGGHGRGEGGRGRGEGGRGRGEGGRGRGEGGPPIYEGGRGRGEGGPPIHEGGRGRGEGGHGRGEGGRGRGEGGRGRGEGGRGRGEGGHGRGEGGRGRGEGGRERGGGRGGKGICQESENKHEKEMAQQLEKSSLLEQPEKKETQATEISQLPKQVPVTQKPSVAPLTAGAVTQQSAPTKVSLPSSVAGQLALSIPNRRRPEVCGTRGRRITVEVNMMQLEINKLNTAVTQYDVVITADPPTINTPKFLMRPIFEAFKNKYFPNRFPAFDGRKIAYSACDLPFGRYVSEEVIIFDQERQQERTFRVEMTKTADLDLSFLKNVKPGFKETLQCQSGIQALDVIMRHGPLTYHIPVGRSIFWNPKGMQHYLANGLELWIGSFTSAIMGWKPLVNVDVTHKGFPKAQGVIELMKEICRTQNDITANDVQRNRIGIDKFLKKLKVHYEIPNIPSSKRTQEVNGLVECPRKNSFSRSDGTTCTIEEYFKIEKRYTIRYPLIPCLWIGSKNKTIHVPPELCTIIAGQVTHKKMDEQQTREMIKYAATSTSVRKKKIMDGFRSLRMNDYPTMKNEFNLSIRAEFEQVPARVLDPPKLEYSKGGLVPVIKGTWRPKEFLNARNLGDNTWTIVNAGATYIKDISIQGLRNGLISGASSVGMFIGQPLTPFRTLRLEIKQLMDYFNDMKKQGLKLVIVIIPEYNPDSYSIVKQVTELKVGVLTQCIKSVTVERKMNAATVGNILLKINSKLNGVNHTIPTSIRPNVLNTPCILIGADVTHPSPDATDIPSIAAVAASFDSTAFKYNIEIRLQPPRKEIIENLAEIIHRQLIFFRAQTNRAPQRIIFYRDGVSEGQLTQVMHYEISAIRQAIRTLSPDGAYSPPITFLVVQKRHHVRFFPTSQQNSDDRNFNVQAGTIVDTHITHPTHIDFYLVSHASIQGTARPTKYKCICNECNMTEDEMEELTYYLCHMFSRCTRSVSYPAPTYYAHLAAFRARALIQNIPIKLDRLADEQKKITVIMKDSPMFYV